MKKKFLSKKSIKKLVILAILLFPFAVLYSLPYIVDIENHKDEFVAEFEATTGRKIVIEGVVEIVPFPFPKIIAKDIALKGREGDYSENTISIGEAEITPSLLSVFIGDIRIKKIVLKQSEVYLESLAGSTPNWIIGNKTEKGEVISDKLNLRTLFFDDLEVFIRTGTKEEVTERSISFATSSFAAESLKGPFVSQGVFASKYKYVTVGYQLDVGDLSSGSADFSFLNSSGTSYLNIKGKVNLDDEGFKVEGVMDSNVDTSIRGIGKSIAGSENKLSDIIANSLSEDGRKVTAKFLLTDKKIRLDEIKMNSPNVNLGGSVGIEFGNVPKLDLSLDIDSLDIDLLLDGGGFLGATEFLFGDVAGAVDQDFLKKILENEAKKKKFILSLPKDMGYKIDVSIGELTHNKAKINDIAVKIERDGDDVKVYHMRASDFPGNISFDWSGSNASIEEYGDEYDKLVIEGDNFIEFLKWLGVKTERVKNDFASGFRVDSDILMEKEGFRISKVKMKMGDYILVGQGLFDKNREIQGELAFRINRINVDDVLYDKKVDHESMEQDAVLFDILRNIDVYFKKLAVSANIEELIVNGQSLRNMNAIAEFSAGNLNVEKFSYSSNSGKFLSRFRLDTTQLQPYLELDIKFDNFDTKFYHKLLAVDFSLEESVAKTQPLPHDNHPKWATDFFSFDRMGILTGKVNLYVKNFRYKNLSIKDIKSSFDISGDKIDVKSFVGRVFGSKLEAKGSVGTRKPFINASFSINNANLNSVFDKFLGYRGSRGKANISGSASVIGHSIFQWAQSLRGQVNIVGRDIVVNGFDMSVLSRQIPKSKVVGDVRYWTDKAFKTGQTPFDYVSGSLVMDQGFVELRNVQLSHLLLKGAYLGGALNIPAWQGNLRLEMPVVATRSSEYIPAYIELKGDISSLSKSWPTKDLEQYWERNFYGATR